jgi:hypothetical protein
MGIADAIGESVWCWRAALFSSSRSIAQPSAQSVVEKRFREQDVYFYRQGLDSLIAGYDTYLNSFGCYVKNRGGLISKCICVIFCLHLTSNHLNKIRKLTFWYPRNYCVLINKLLTELSGVRFIISQNLIIALQICV